MTFFTQQTNGYAFSTELPLVLVTPGVFAGNHPVVFKDRNVRFLMWE